MLYLANAGAFGIAPGGCARLITASVGEPWRGLGALSCHSARQVPVAPVIRDALALPGPRCGTCGW
jgi:hypothetical protein